MPLLSSLVETSRPSAFRFGALLFVASFGAASAATSIHLVNHQDYAIHLPVTLRQTTPAASALSNGQPIQRDGADAVFVAAIPAKGQQEIAFRSSAPTAKNLMTVAAATSGIQFTVAGRDAGKLTWQVVVAPARKATQTGELLSTQADYTAPFVPAPLAFSPKATGTVFDTWTAAATQAGLALAIELRVFHEGFVDVRARLTNESAPTRNVSAALVARWEHPALASRTVCYDNRRRAFATTDSTLFHRTDGRFWHIQHGVDWVRSEFSNGTSVVWINPFDPVFTLEKGKARPTYAMGSQAQFGHETQSVPGALFSVTELARQNVRSYRDRVVENSLPPIGESLEITTRLAGQAAPLGDDAADQLFLGTTAYRAQHTDAGKVTVDFGVPAVRFGTSYFPYSTFGENFDAAKLPGMDREGFWPLAADTVREWPKFADQIRQDLRLIKWMGFSLVRLHHLELLAPIEKNVRLEYLDFLFGELRHLGLKAMLDVYAAPAQLEELLVRYGDAVDSVEIENETLIWGIPRDHVAEWKELAATVKRVTPHAKIFWTAQNNTGMFDRLAALGVNSDSIDLHSYVDALDALPSARGWALALGDYATRVGKPATISEWNYRGLTRLTPEARAKVYPQIFENALGTRSIADFYEFQFQETMTPNPVSGRGNILRHYELFNLSRHPKLEAFEFRDLMQRYLADDDPAKRLAVGYAETDLDHAGHGSASITLTNHAAHALALRATVEAPAELKMELKGAASIALRPGETLALPVALATVGTKPGFYHGAIRLEGTGGFLRYAPVEARLTGEPSFQTPDAATARFLTHVSAVVYGVQSPVIEVETAIAVAQSLESATGRVIPFFQLDDLPPALRTAGNLIVVGTAQTNPLARETGENLLVLTGPTPSDTKTAGMNFILRYWPAAKDSAAGKVGLVRKALPRGIDPAKLP
jgi:hypothetical protein